MKRVSRRNQRCKTWACLRYFEGLKALRFDGEDSGPLETPEWIDALHAVVAKLSFGDIEPILHSPGPLLLTASIASLLSVGASVALLLPLVWRNREDWSRLAATRHSCIVALFLMFGALLGAWGLLAPWA